MDLTYADSNRRDIGILQGFTADFAFGRDENNFAVQIPFDYAKGKEPVEAGYIFYIDGTEYGGIVDSITVDTAEEVLTYEGRTWRGILAEKVIEPQADLTYKWNFQSYTGEANAIIQEIIELAGMDDYFSVPYISQQGVEIIADSEVDIDGYQFRYDVVLTGLMDMLAENSGKLVLRYDSKTKKCLVGAEPLVNYSALSDIDSSQTELIITKEFTRINHVICIGRWYFEDRFVIHVFGDGGGGVLPYLHDMSKEPIDDDDYILDKSQQIFFGIDERTVVIEDEDAEDVENYRLLTSKPDDWDKNYTDYYMVPEDATVDDIEEIEANIQPDYRLLDERPADWNTAADTYFYLELNEDDEWEYKPCSSTIADVPKRVPKKPDDWDDYYMNYLKKVGNEYEAIKGVDDYKPLSKEPSNWRKNYGDYFIWNGTEYVGVSGESKNKYVPITKKPSLWAENWSSFYVNQKGKYKQISDVEPYKTMLSDNKKVTPPKFVAKKYYAQESRPVPPSFKKYSSVYKKKVLPPKFTDQTVYKKVEKITNDYTWEPDTFYRYHGEKDFGLEFVPNVYYKKVFDHYYNIVEQAVEELTAEAQTDTMEIEDNANVEPRWEYDIGDIAGGTEDSTGIEIAATITKKIVHIEEGLETISYEME